MNKSDLIEAMATVVETKKAAQDVVDFVFATITRALQNQEVVTITGFGTFKTSQRSARTGRNPQTGAAIAIKARKVPKFIPGKALKTALN